MINLKIYKCKALYVAIKCFVVFGLFIFLSSCNTNLEEIEKIEAKKFVKEEFGENVEILITKKGKASTKITAPTVIRNYESKPFNEFPDGMILYVYNENGELESELKAKYGRLGDGSSTMTAKDSVVVINKKGESLHTEHLIWDKNNALIKTEGFVKITTQDEIIYGDGFESNEDFSAYTITNIHGLVKIKEEE